MILAHHEKFEIPQREGRTVDTQKMNESWDAIVEFATHLKEDILGKSPRKKADEEEETGSAETV